MPYIWFAIVLWAGVADLPQFALGLSAAALGLVVVMEFVRDLREIYHNILEENIQCAGGCLYNLALTSREEG